MVRRKIRRIERKIFRASLFFFFRLAIDRIENEIRYENRIPIPNSIPEQISTSKTIPEDEELQKDTVDYGFHSLITGSRPKFTGLMPPPVAPRRSRQNSACSTQSSVRYAS